MDIRISDYDLSCELLKTLSENCSKLANLRFNLRFNHSRPLPIVKNCFKQLKMLIVPELKFIDALISDTNSLTKLFIEQATMDELRNFDLSTIGMKFKKLKKCYINVRPGRYTGQYFSKRSILLDFTNSMQEMFKKLGIFINFIFSDKFTLVLIFMPRMFQ